MFKTKKIFTETTSVQLGLHLSFYFLVTLILATFVLTLWFLYQKFYLTLTQAEEIIILKSQLAVQDLDYTLYTKINNQILAKTQQSPYNWEAIKNPFINVKP